MSVASGTTVSNKKASGLWGAVDASCTAVNGIFPVVGVDLLYNNTSEIKPERHSTDTHGTNQGNFWTLRTFGYRVAPRYRDLHKKMGSLVGFQHSSHYRDFLIKPSNKVKEELIEQEWPNIQRIMVSLAQKDVTQATIIRKLASYVR